MPPTNGTSRMAHFVPSCRSKNLELLCSDGGWHLTANFYRLWVAPILMFRPNWMTKEIYRSLPEQLELREVQYVISEPGRKQSPFVVVTTMLDRSGDDGVSSEEISELYGFRWNVELEIRSIKTHLNIDFMRCKSLPMANWDLACFSTFGARCVHSPIPSLHIAMSSRS